MEEVIKTRTYDDFNDIEVIKKTFSFGKNIEYFVRGKIDNVEFNDFFENLSDALNAFNIIMNEFKQTI